MLSAQESHVTCGSMLGHRALECKFQEGRPLFLWFDTVSQPRVSIQHDYFPSHTQGIVLVAQLCPTLCNPTKSSRPGSSVHGILQAIILEWIPFSNAQGRLPKKLINLFLFYFWLPWVFIAVCGLSAGGESGVYSLSVAVWASYCGGVFCCRTRALGGWVSSVTVLGLTGCGPWA